MIQLPALALEHATAIQLLLQDEAVLDMTRLPQPYPENGAVGFIQYLQPRMANGEEYAYAIVRDGEVVGMCGVMFEAGIAQIGYWLGQAYWRQGIATNAVGQLIDVCRHELGLDYIEAHSLKRNMASTRLLTGMGFSQQREQANTYAKWSPDEVIQIFGLALTRA